ncbi:hypothetical protein LJC04_04695 [Ruminococcaceae bacterium OttesenSCG-928-O06]|nr:hypothetical protein [Ruminococcaceae bacterium OttesenSCG-928-O06]
MNERVAAVGNQVKDAFNKLKETWEKQDAQLRKRILIIGLGLIALAVGLVIVLNVVGGRYVVVYEAMGNDESVRGMAALNTSGINSRVNDKGQLEVPSKDLNQAMIQLALQNIPSTTLDYSIMDNASGLTTTEYEKRKAWVQQQQNRIQDTLKTLNGVQNAIVSLNINTESNRMWDTASTRNSASVTIHMNQGYALGPGQVTAVRNIVSAGVGIDATDVSVVDQNGNLLAAAGEEYNAAASVADSFLERLNLEAEVEARLRSKALELLSGPYPNTEKLRVTCTVALDFDAMVTEIKEYQDWNGTGRGVLDEEEMDLILGMVDLIAGVVGETDNTDVPIYVDENGDGVPEAADYHHYKDYAVSYILKQIEKASPSLAGVSMGVVILDTASADTLQSIRTLLANGTSIPLENITVQNFVVPPDEVVTTPGFFENIFGNLPPLFLYIGIAVIAVILVVLILLLVLRRRGKKRKLALVAAAQEAEQAEAERIQAEIEERKRQLKNAAISEQSEDAIAGEVREFARNNPEITANLLRNWLKEGD